MKLPGVISLRKLLPTWAMPNGGFLRRRLEHVGEVDEHALRRLGAQVHLGRRVLDRAGVGLEHQVEGAGLGEAALAPQLGQTSGSSRWSSAEPVLAVRAVDQRIA